MRFIRKRKANLFVEMRRGIVCMGWFAALTVTSILTFVTPAAGETVQAVQIRVNTDKGETRVAGPVDQLIRITLAKRRTIGIRTTFVESAHEYQVVVLRASSGRDPKMLNMSDFTPLETFALKVGDSASHQLADGGVVDVTIPTGAVLETSGGEVKDCTCCVTCDNGVVICGCKVRSSCGNCG